MNKQQHNTGKVEWYTPAHIIEAARGAMGSIDLDPASCATANTIVKAKLFYTKDDGWRRNISLSLPWHGNVWLNPPYKQPLCTQFVEKLVREYGSWRVEKACLLVNNATETKWFQYALEHSTAQCFIRGCVKFLDEKLVPQKSPLHGSVVFYFGSCPIDFERFFAPLGCVLLGRKAK